MKLHEKLKTVNLINVNYSNYTTNYRFKSNCLLLIVTPRSINNDNKQIVNTINYKSMVSTSI